MNDGPIDLDPDLAELLDRQYGHADTLDPDDAGELDMTGLELAPGLNGGTLIRIQDTEAGRARAQQMQAASRGKAREARKLRADRTAEKAGEILAEVKASLDRTHESQLPSVGKMADKIVRMMGGLLLNGGPMYAPTTAKEASDIAKQWASIGAQHRAGRAMDKITETVGVEVTPEAVIQNLTELQTKLAAKAAERAATPGQVRQLGGPIDTTSTEGTDE